MYVFLGEGDVIREGDEVEAGGGNGYSWGDAARMRLIGQRVGTDLIARRKLTGWEAVKHALKAEVLGSGKEGCETTRLFWDCECEHKYIQQAGGYLEEGLCPQCGARQSDQPNARKAEVILEIIEEK